MTRARCWYLTSEFLQPLQKFRLRTIYSKNDLTINNDQLYEFFIIMSHSEHQDVYHDLCHSSLGLLSISDGGELRAKTDKSLSLKCFTETNSRNKSMFRVHGVKQTCRNFIIIALPIGCFRNRLR